MAVRTAQTVVHDLVRELGAEMSEGPTVREWLTGLASGAPGAHFRRDEKGLREGDPRPALILGNAADNVLPSLNTRALQSWANDLGKRALASGTVQDCFDPIKAASNKAWKRGQVPFKFEKRPPGLCRGGSGSATTGDRGAAVNCDRLTLRRPPRRSERHFLWQTPVSRASVKHPWAKIMRVAITAFVFTLGLALGVGIGNQRFRGTPVSSTGPAVVAEVLHIAPPTLSRFYVTPHAPSELQELGDKDGIDYIPARFTNGQLRIHHGAGLQNEDFVGFGMPVRAPLSGKVIRVRHPTGVNALGKMSESEVGLVAIQATNGAVLVLAHLARIPVEEGSHVEIGSALGFVSNNGSSRNPHVHLGAFRNGQSMLIEFDRNALDATLTKVGEMGH